MGGRVGNAEGNDDETSMAGSWYLSDVVGDHLLGNRPLRSQTLVKTMRMMQALVGFIGLLAWGIILYGLIHFTRLW